MPRDAINIAQWILDAKADYLLAVKDNQPTLHADIKSYFETALSNEVERVETVVRSTAGSRFVPIRSPMWSIGSIPAFLSGRPLLPENQHYRHGREPDRARR
jgi:hypothetical protein